MRSKKSGDTGDKPNLGLGGIFKGLEGLVSALGDLAEKGQELSRSGEIQFEGKERDLRGVYGFSVKVGLGGDGVKVEPFGNIRQDKKSGKSVVQEICEPIVDVFDEDEYTLVVAEMPGVGVDDLKLDVKDDLLTIHAERGSKKYHKEVLLPRSYTKEATVVSCNNGILEIKCKK